MQNFLGKDGFNWFYGVVEEINDPTKTGRVKVRIFGHHTDNLQELPTTGLPWAQTIQSTSSSKTFIPPRLGDYVVGFFSDGLSAQAPVIIGVLPGLEAKQDTSKGFSPQSKLKPATPPEGQKQYTPGEPTLAPLARGIIENTAISQSNKNLAHVCDISPGLKLEIVKLSMNVNNLMNTLRTELQAIWASTSSSPFGNQVKVAVETLKSKIKVIQKFTKLIQQNVSMLQQYVAQLEALVKYILTLPTRIAELLKKCLNEALSGIQSSISLGKTFSDLQASAGANATSEIVNVETTLANKQTVTSTVLLISKP
jgi:hypothetical protein